MVDLNDMVIFAKVAEFGGISKAANELSMPKSKVSRRMANLELALGVRLLERTTRSVRLTEIGKIYFQHCKKVVNEAKQAENSVNQLLNTPTGHLKISTSISIGQHIVAPHLAEFLSRYPDITIEHIVTNRRVDLISEEFDLAIRIGALEDSSLISKKLSTSHALLVASPVYLASAGALTDISDLTQHKALCMGDSSIADQWRFVNAKGKEEQVKVKPVATVNDMTILRTLCIASSGYRYPAELYV